MSVMGSCPFPYTLKERNSKGEPVSVPCGQCSICKMQTAKQWSCRLRISVTESQFPYFLTLTYDDNNLHYVDCVEKVAVNEKEKDVYYTCPWDDFAVQNGLKPSLVPEHITNFIKQLRHHLPKGFKYYCVGEYGSKTKRPHYHMIVWNTLPKIEFFDLLEKYWKYGHFRIDTVTPASIMYVTKYHVNKNFSPPDTVPSFARMSKGIGAEFVNKTNLRWYNEIKNSTDRTFISFDKCRYSMPRYLRDKIFNPLVWANRKQKKGDWWIDAYDEAAISHLEKFPSDLRDPTEVAYANRIHALNTVKKRANNGKF